VSCDPERVTGYVDGELGLRERAEVEAHLAGCPTCSAQVREERALRERLRALAALDPRPQLEAHVRARLARARRPRLAIWLPLAAALLLGLLWARAQPPLLALQLAYDHGHCFGKRTLPAQVWTGQFEVAQRHFAARGRPLPALPAAAGGAELVGARVCPLLDRGVAHLYYSGEGKRVSLFVLPEPVRLRHDYGVHAFGQAVRLRRVAGQAVAIVSSSAEDVAAFEQAFDQTVARLDAPAPR
jgi:anti-sigma factor RsiW